MKVLIAGASGAIGRPLIRCLRENRHAVTALVRSPESSRTVAEAGAEPVIADAFDASTVQEAVARVRPDAVINELTALPRHYTPAKMAAAERDRTVCIEGNTNLLAALGAARAPLSAAELGVWYAPGPGLADEREPFAVSGSPAVSAGSRRYAELENAASMTPGIAVVALRYGFFYGPSTWFSGDGDMGEQVRLRQVPVIGDG